MVDARYVNSKSAGIFTNELQFYISRRPAELVQWKSTAQYDENDKLYSLKVQTW